MGEASKRCLGAFAFVWGWKWETTGTWYGVFNEWPEVTEGVAVNCPVCESEVMETMETCWTGEHPVCRAGVPDGALETTSMTWVCAHSGSTLLIFRLKARNQRVGGGNANTWG